MKRHAAMTEFIISVDQQHTVACRDTEQRYETDNGRDTDNLVREENRKHTTDKGERQVKKHC